MSLLSLRNRLFGAGVLLILAVAGPTAFLTSSDDAPSANPVAEAVPPAIPVSVAAVQQQDVAIWSEFSGRLEAVERVEIRSRVAGAVQAVHFREGALVHKGDRLMTIDPAPYAAEVERLRAQVLAAETRLSLAGKDRDRGQQLQQSGSNAISQSAVDQRESAYQEAQANLAAARAALQAAELNLGYTEIRAPVSGRVGRLEITVGNLVEAGPGAPVLTRLVSVDPIYAGFNADEEVVTRALKELGADVNAHTQVERIPVEMVTVTGNGTPLEGRLQLIDNQVDARSGTVRVRAVFDNADGSLLPGQFARLRMGRAAAEPALLVSERAIGTDQDKRYVVVVGGDNTAVYREVKLGPTVDNLRVVTSGLQPGERIVVNGLQRIRPGARVEPQMVSMNGSAPAQTAAASDSLQR